LLYLFLLL
jgi:hypothetical protein